MLQLEFIYRIWQYFLSICLIIMKKYLCSDVNRIFLCIFCWNILVFKLINSTTLKITFSRTFTVIILNIFVCPNFLWITFYISAYFLQKESCVLFNLIVEIFILLMIDNIITVVIVIECLVNKWREKNW